MIVVRPLEHGEALPSVPYIPNVQSYGGGCQHWHRPHFPCGNTARYAVGDERLCWSHTSARIRQLMFQRVPIQVQTQEVAA